MTASAINASAQYVRAANINTLAQTLALSAIGAEPDIISELALLKTQSQQTGNYTKFLDALQQILRVPTDQVTVGQIQSFVRTILAQTVGV